MDQLHFNEPVANKPSISDTNNIRIRTALNMFYII